MAASFTRRRVASKGCQRNEAMEKRGRQEGITMRAGEGPDIGCRYTVGAFDRLAMRSLVCDRRFASISAVLCPTRRTGKFRSRSGRQVRKPRHPVQCAITDQVLDVVAYLASFRDQGKCRIAQPFVP